MSAQILLHSGYMFDLESPETSYIGIEDIAHALSHACRFTGQCDTFYSVAQHCVNVSFAVPTGRLALQALLHDASEAYTGDMNSPLKSLCPEFRAIEDRIQRDINARFCLPVEEDRLVKLADRRAFDAEREILFAHELGPLVANRLLLEYSTPLPPAEAKTLFLSRFYAVRKHD